MEKFSVTKATMFEGIAKVIDGMGFSVNDIDVSAEEVQKFLIHQIEMASRPAERKVDEAKVKANQQMMEEILFYLAHGSATCTDIAKNCPSIPSSQKASSLLQSMTDKVVRKQDGKKVTFSLA